MSENRIDPTVAGLFLVAFITLVFGFLGIQFFQGGSAMDWGLHHVAADLALVVGAIFVVLTVSAIRFGNAFAASLFGFVAVSLIAVQYGFLASPFMFYLLAIVYIVFALVALLIGAPKLLVILLFFVGLLYFFVGLFSNAGIADGDTYALLFGIFGILAGVVALYMAFALSTQKLPVF